MWVGSVNALRKSPIYPVAAALHIQPAKSLYGSKLPAAFCTACAFTWYNARYEDIDNNVIKRESRDRIAYARAMKQMVKQ